jgi:hypothetical protein
LNAAGLRAAARTAGLLGLLITAGCSSRSLAELSAGWAIDAGAPAVAPAGPEAGSPVADGGRGAVDEEPATPDPIPPFERDAQAPLDTEPSIDAAAGAMPDAPLPLPRVALLVSRISIGRADTAIVRRLTGLGLAPEVHDDSETATLDLTGVDLVFMSATAESAKVGSALREVARPIIVSEPFSFDAFGMTTKGAGGADVWGIDSQQTMLAISMPGHPMAGGLRGQVVVADQPVRLNWGTPPKDALAIAHLIADPTRVALFAYEAGSQMAGLTAPARRVGFFLDLRTANDLGPNGWTLFDAAVNWALGR